MVEVDQTWFAILTAMCCAPSVGFWFRLRLREFRAAHGSARTAPGRFMESCVDGVMMGLGTGLAAACAVLIVEILLFHALR